MSREFDRAVLNTGIADVSDQSKVVAINVSGATTATTTILGFNQTTGRTITFPDATTTVVGTDTADSLSNKLQIDVDNIRLDGNTISITDTNGDLTFTPDGTGKVIITSDLDVQGTTTSIDSTNVNIADSYLYQSKDYNTAAARTGGSVINYLPTATTTTVTTNGFNTTSTVQVTSSAGFTAADIIQISNANNASNDGIFEISAVAAGQITIDLTPSEDFTNSIFVTDATAQGTATKVGVTIMRTADGSGGVAAGDWETGKGNTVPFTFTGLSPAGAPVFAISSSIAQYNSANPGFALTNDFVVCSSSLDDIGPTGDLRMFFDQSLGAFRAGRVNGTQWDLASRGEQSVAFGFNTIASGQQAVVAGGQTNTASGNESVIGGGLGNICDATQATVAGGNSNTSSAVRAFIGAGNSNVAGGSDAVVGGGNGNEAQNIQSAICGGGSNVASNSNVFIGGGSGNTASGSRAIICGGLNNTSDGTQSIVVGGSANSAGGIRSFVGGGGTVSATALESVVVGGRNNIASAAGAFVGGGDSNTAGGTESIVPGGGSNTANGNQSFAAGESANDNNNNNTFVWSDSNGLTATAATADSWWVGCAGGATFYSNALHTTGVTMAAGANAWAGVSDRNVKENFIELDGEDILEKVAELPIYQYNFIGSDPDQIYRSPVAQDWHSLFPSGKDPLKIDTLDLDGISLSAIKGLIALVRDQGERIRILEERRSSS